MITCVCCFLQFAVVIVIFQETTHITYIGISTITTNDASIVPMMYRLTSLSAYKIIEKKGNPPLFFMYLA